MSEGRLPTGLVLKAVALAMGVATVVLSLLGKFQPSMVIFPGIGLFALSLASLLREE